MKITKAKLKQIIKEELSCLSEADAFSHHADGWDAAGTSQAYNPDVEGMPPEEQADPVVAAIAKVEDLRGLIENGDPGGEGALAALDELWDHLQSMLTVPSNEVPMSR
tara:strand:- start:1154 stop:1477 length:324 start_codon:yes stop_codon:yes gene_type:complete